MKVSVITVCLNAEKTLNDTLASVAQQDYPDVEHVIVDGGSTDNSLILAERWASPKLKVESGPDKGIYNAMNKGLARASGELVCFLNADDFFLRPDAVSLMVDAASASTADCFFGGTRFVRSDGGGIARRLYTARGFRPWWLRVGMMPPHPSAFITRQALLRAHGFDESFRIAGDFDLIARLILRHRVNWKVVPHVVTGFREGGISTSGPSTRSMIEKELVRSLSGLGLRRSGLAVKVRLLLKLCQFANLRPARQELFFRRTA